MYIPLNDLAKDIETLVDPQKYKNENVLARILIRVEESDKMLREMKRNFSQVN